MENVLSKQLKFDPLFDHVVFGLYAVDSAVNSVCMYLSFIIADQHYQCLCGWMDRRCRVCCRLLTNIKVTRSKAMDDLPMESAQRTSNLANLSVARRSTPNVN